MRLTPPTKIVFIISLVAAIVAVLQARGYIHGVPFSAVWTMAIAYGILLVGCLFDGL